MNARQVQELLAMLEAAKVKPPMGKRGQGFNEGLAHVQRWLKRRNIFLSSELPTNTNVPDERIGEYR